jgi:hypothetical protein
MASLTALSRRLRLSWRFMAYVSLGLAMVVLALVASFNRLIYPPMALWGVGRHQFQEALRRVAAGYAASESLTRQELLWSRVRELDPQGPAYAWGTFQFLSPRGEEVFFWASVAWSPALNCWKRQHCQHLADPQDKVLFAESILSLGNLEKILYSVENWGREMRRRIREVEFWLWGGHLPGEEETTGD